MTRSRALVAATAFAVAFLLLLPPALRKGFDHDEHQFVAAGALLAGEGLLPYRDYPYFHVPNLPLVYAALFTLTDHRLLAARLFSVPRWTPENRPVVDGAKPASGSTVPGASVLPRSMVVEQAALPASSVSARGIAR